MTDEKIILSLEPSETPGAITLKVNDDEALQDLIEALDAQGLILGQVAGVSTDPRPSRR